MTVEGFFERDISSICKSYWIFRRMEKIQSRHFIVKLQKPRHWENNNFKNRKGKANYLLRNKILFSLVKIDARRQWNNIFTYYWEVTHLEYDARLNFLFKSNGDKDIFRWRQYSSHSQTTAGKDHGFPRTLLLIFALKVLVLMFACFPPAFLLNYLILLLYYPDSLKNTYGLQ